MLNDGFKRFVGFLLCVMIFSMCALSTVGN